MDEGCGVLPEVKQMVDGWVISDDEVVRRLGMEVEKKHKAAFSQSEGSVVSSDDILSILSFDSLF